MAPRITPEKIAYMKEFLRSHPPDPAYDEEAEYFDGTLPETEFYSRAYRDILKELGELPEETDNEEEAAEYGATHYP